MAATLSKGRRKLALIPKASAVSADAISVTVLAAATWNPSDYALVDGFVLGVTGENSVVGTPIGARNVVNIPDDPTLEASINYLRDTVEANDEAWAAHTGPGIEFWGVLRQMPTKYANEDWEALDDIEVYDLTTGTPYMRQDAEVSSFHVTYQVGSGTDTSQTVKAGA